MASGSEPLDILCDEALKLHTRVRFRDPEIDGVVDLEDRSPDEYENEASNGYTEMFELEGLSEASSRAAAECIADLLFERRLDARLEQAFFNKQRNTKRYAYGELSVLDFNKRKNAVLREPREAPSQPQESRTVCSDDSGGRHCGPHGADAQDPAHADAAACLGR